MTGVAPGARRHVFIQYASGHRLVVRDWRGDAESATGGTVEQASYLRDAAGGDGPSGTGWWDRFVRWWRSGPEGGIGVPTLRFALPFDANGRDTLGLVDPATGTLDGADDPLGSVRRVEGKVVCLLPRQPGDEVVMRDAWIEQPPVWRMVDGIDFAVQPTEGPPVAVCCAMAPLLIAAPTTRTVREHLGEDARLREVTAGVRHARDDAQATCVEIREGDRVEALGVVCEPRASVRRFDVVGRSAPYRGDARLISLIIGDEPGTRLVLRKLTGPAAAKP